MPFGGSCDYRRKFTEHLKKKKKDDGVAKYFSRNFRFRLNGSASCASVMKTTSLKSGPRFCLNLTLIYLCVLH